MPSIYMLVRDQNMRLVKNSGYRHGDKLPSERELADACNCTRITLREGLLQLEYDGFIYRQARQGWFLAPPPLVYDPSMRANFSKLIEDQNRSGRTELIDARLNISPDADILNAVQPQNGQSVIEIIRRRYLDDRAILLEEIYLDAKDFSGVLDIDLEQSLTQVLSRDYKISIEHEETRIKSNALDLVQAEHLSVAQGSPCMTLWRVRRDGTGRCIEYNREYWLHNAVEISISSQTR